MSILIKGMEMPTSCFDCPFMYGRRYCRVNSKIEFADPEYSELKGRYNGCPLVPVPEHGRLIDADALKKNAYPFPCAIGTEWAVTLRQINDAPAIIPADKEVEG